MSDEKPTGLEEGAFAQTKIKSLEDEIEGLYTTFARMKRQLHLPAETAPEAVADELEQWTTELEKLLRTGFKDRDGSNFEDLPEETVYDIADRLLTEHKRLSEGARWVLQALGLKPGPEGYEGETHNWEKIASSIGGMVDLTKRLNALPIQGQLVECVRILFGHVLRETGAEVLDKDLVVRFVDAMTGAYTRQSLAQAFGCEVEHVPEAFEAVWAHCRKMVGKQTDRLGVKHALEQVAELADIAEQLDSFWLLNRPKSAGFKGLAGEILSLSGGEPILLSISEPSLRALLQITEHGIYGWSVREVATRAIDGFIQGFVRPKRVRL